MLRFGRVAPLLASALLVACAEAPPPPSAAPPAAPCITPGVRELLDQGAAAVKSGNVDAAIPLHEEAARLSGEDHRVLFRLAMAHRKKERWTEAEAALARAADKAPSNAIYWLERGYALLQRAKHKEVSWEAARAALAKSIALDPGLADAHELLGQVQLRLDDEAAALASFTRAAELDPREIAYFNALADLWIRLGQPKEAEAVLREAKEFAGRARPNEKALYGMHVLLAQVYQEREAMPEMVAELEEARGHVAPDSPEQVQMFFMLGSSYTRLRPPRNAEAIEMLKMFQARACRGAKASIYRVECEMAVTLVSKLGAPEAP